MVEAAALADEGERMAGELRHAAGKQVCALEIALVSSQTERAAGSGQRACSFSELIHRRHYAASRQM